MSDLSARLSLPYLAPGQAQKHVTHNEALGRLDLIVQLAVQAFGATTPPVAPAEGEVWATGAAPTGAWAGQGDRLAAWADGAWLFVTPGTGWRAWGVAEAEIRVWQGTSWVAGGVPSALQNLTHLGVQTTADATNRLSVQSDASLFSHDGAGHQMKINKSGPGQTGSVLFQSGFSGRAEIGLLGDNDLTVKVSNDGTTFADALIVKRTTGEVRLPQGVLADGFTLRDPGDSTRAGVFSVAGIDTATTRSYTLPNLSGTLALLQGAQVFAGPVTLSGGASVAGGLGADQIGVGGAVADATNRLSVNAPATLLNHAGTSHEVTVNKAAPANDAAVAFKTGFSARALLGLLADDAWTLKVSPDGTAFTTALVADAATGRVSLPQGGLLGGLAADPVSPGNGTLWHNSTTGLIRARVAGATRSLSGLATPFLVPPAGEHVLTTMGSGTSLGTLAGAAGRIEIYPFAPRADLVVDALSINVTTAVAGALAKAVVYASDANGRPDTLLAETGDFNCATTGVKTVTQALTLWAGATYWLGIRHSATATLSAWQAYATPDINGGAPSTAARAVLRRTLAFATPATTSWGFLSSEISSATPTAIWLRMG